jgi:hypothetical protein
MIPLNKYSGKSLTASHLYTLKTFGIDGDTASLL